VAFLALRIVRSAWTSLSNATSARRQGCKPALVYPHKDPLLGLDFFLAAVKSLKSYTILDSFVQNFRDIGNTFWVLSLGRWMLLTNEPENVKAIMALKFDDWPIGGPRLWALEPIMGPRSVFASNGKIWHDARAMIRPSFVRDQIADLQRFDKHIGKLIARIPPNEKFDLQELIQAMTMDSSTDFMYEHAPRARADSV
jgi:cytochrome P450